MDPAEEVTVTNEIPGEILEDRFTIRQASLEFSKYTEYTIKVIPTNPIPRLGWVEVELPAHVGIIEDKNMINDQYVGVTRGGTENEYEKSNYDKFIETCKIETTQNYPTVGKDINICNLRVIKKTGSIQRFVTIYNTYL